jgi:polyhydroxyalkanoate synthesis regulator phasin
MSTPEDRYTRTPHQDDQYTRGEGAPAAGGPTYDPDAEPATQGDVKSLRRWLIVAAVWAVAASAIAVIALIDDDTASNGDGDDTAQEARAASRVERRLESRIADLEQRVENVPSSDQVDELNGRVEDLEGQVDDLGGGPSQDDIDDLNSRIDDLEQRIEDVENQQQQQP